MRQHFIGGNARTGRRKPPERKTITAAIHEGCGGNVIVTTNKYGIFYGCSKCRRPTTAEGGQARIWTDADEPF